jgi:hypothetical protein
VNSLSATGECAIAPSSYTFDVWKTRLLENCVKRDQLKTLTEIGDSVLQLFWARGIEPTPEAIVDDVDKVG